VALASRQSLSEVESWSDEQFVTVLQELHDHAQRMKEAHQ
jgi:hypothetical protein